MYCENCGSKNSDTAKYCSECGCIIDSAKKEDSSFFESSEPTAKTIYYMQNVSPYYREEFKAISNSGESYKGKFNICAFLFGALWALTKGLYVPAIIAIVLGIFTFGIGSVVYWFIFGMRGNWMYYNLVIKNKNLPI